MPRKPKLLIAGGGYADIPLIRAAKRLGYYVITSGNRPDDLGHAYADECRLADFSDPDAMLGIARDSGVAAVCACCNDFSALSSAYVAERLGLPGHDPLETTQTIHHKDRFRRFSLAHGFPVPQAAGASTPEQAQQAIAELSLPVIVKPVDLTGGKGVSTVALPAQADTAIRKAFEATRLGRIVVETFIEGSRHGFSAFLHHGRVVFYFSDNEHYFLNPYLVGAASVPSIVPAEVERRLVAICERYAALLQLTDGIFHVQYILRGADPYVIEICRRAPGDLYIRLVELATGINYAEYIVRGAAGLDCSALRHVAPRGCYVRHCVMPLTPGRLREVAYAPSIRPHIVDEMNWWSAGEVVESENILHTKFGIVFMRFDLPEAMWETMENIHDLITPVMDG